MKFQAVTPHLAFMRETHRHVLSWTRFEGRSVKAFTVTMTKPDAKQLREALAIADVDWRSEDGLLHVTRHDDGFVLTFRDVGETDGETLRLDREESERFAAGAMQLAGR